MPECQQLAPDYGGRHCGRSGFLLFLLRFQCAQCCVTAPRPSFGQWLPSSVTFIPRYLPVRLGSMFVLSPISRSEGEVWPVSAAFYRFRRRLPLRCTNQREPSDSTEFYRPALTFCPVSMTGRRSSGRLGWGGAVAGRGRRERRYRGGRSGLSAAAVTASWTGGTAQQGRHGAAGTGAARGPAAEYRRDGTAPAAPATPDRSPGMGRRRVW